MNETTRAYISGFFDGEGCVAVKKARWENGSRSISLAIAQKRPKVLYLIQSWLNRLSIPSTISSPHRKNGNVCWRLVITGRENVLLVLKLMSPYIVVKKDEVDTAIEYLHRLIAEDRTYGEPLPKAELAIRNQLTSRILERRE